MHKQDTEKPLQHIEKTRTNEKKKKEKLLTLPLNIFGETSIKKVVAVTFLNYFDPRIIAILIP